MNRFMNNRSTRLKLILSFAAILVLLGGVTVTAYAALMNSAASEQEIHDIHFTDALNLRQLRSHQNYIRRRCSI
jgi:CHASE3 domain sensor protein